MPILSNFPGGGGTTEQASSTQAGITKLYTATGSNTDGAMTQKAVTEQINTLDAKIPTTTSDLENDSGFVESDDIISVTDGEEGQVLTRTADGATFITLISYGTAELVDGVSPLATGTLYVCYEVGDVESSGGTGGDNDG